MSINDNLNSNSVPELSSKHGLSGGEYDIDNSPSLSSKHGLSSKQYDIGMTVNQKPHSLPSINIEKQRQNHHTKEDGRLHKKDIDDSKHGDNPGMAPEHKILILGIFSIVGVLIWGLRDR